MTDTSQEQAKMTLGENRARLLSNCDHEWEHSTDRPRVPQTSIFETSKCKKCSAISRKQILQEDYDALARALLASQTALRGLLRHLEDIEGPRAEHPQARAALLDQGDGDVTS